MALPEDTPSGGDGVGGFGASHEPSELFPIVVSPATGKEKNTIRMDLFPVACWKLNDVRFAFGSSFPLPEAASEFRELAELRAQHPGAPLSIFGHADPVGDDEFNKALSGHRAEAIYAVLVRDVTLWENRYKSAGAAEGWGIGSIQQMLAAVGENPGPPTGAMNSTTRAAVESFQSKNGATVDGDPGPATRAILFRQYMDFLSPEVLAKSDFLARGADAQGKGDYQGCSEFNPIMVFSQAENAELNQPSRQGERNQQNSVNRRVMALLFRPGSVVNAQKWPCPRASEGTAGCRKRFWSDGEARRSNQANRREFLTTEDTFACRFYHRLVVDSPCENVNPPVVAATLEVIVDNNDDHHVDASEPVAEFVRVGIWDHAFAAATGALINNEAEAQNFVGADSTGADLRRFYFRVRDRAARGRAQVQLNWHTAFDGAGDDHVPVSEAITLLPTSNPEIFVSRAVFLVTDDVDQLESTNSGLPAGNADAGLRAPSDSNHRIRRITVSDAHRLSSNVVATYTPTGGGTAVTRSVPVFRRSPDERLKIKIHLVNIRNTAGGTLTLSAAEKTRRMDALIAAYARCGIFAEIDEFAIDPPASCIGWNTRYPGDPLTVGADPSIESFGFTGGNLIPSASQTDVINIVRARPDFGANDIYILYVHRIFETPLPAPSPTATNTEAAGGISYPDSWTPANSIARNFAFVAIQGSNFLADAHETTHITTNLRNNFGGHFDLGADAAASPGNIDGRNLMQRFVLIANSNTADSKRIWNSDFTNNVVSPAVTIPNQMAAIRGSRFVQPL